MPRAEGRTGRRKNDKASTPVSASHRHCCSPPASPSLLLARFPKKLFCNFSSVSSRLPVFDLHGATQRARGRSIGKWWRGETKRKCGQTTAILMRGSLEAVAVARDVASPSPLKASSALDMMRYQRLSPDCLPLANGSGGASRKPASRSCKDDDAPAVATDSSRLASYLSASPLEPKPLRARAPQPSSSSAGPSPARDHAHHPSFPSDSSDTASPSSTGGTVPAAAGVGDVLLQWGHNKRSRGRRDAAAAPSPQRRQAGGKIQRRASAPAEKLMPPPGASYTRGSNLRATSSFPARGGGGGGGAGDGHHHHRSAEERSGGPPRAEKRSPDRAHKPKVDAGMHPDSKSHSHIHHQDHQSDHHHHHDSPLVAANGSLAGEKLSLEHFEWPRIYISLSRKEKEDDFLAMKGTKLPQRPKKRAKNVDKTLQYVFPGMWLSDLTRGRYEVREKKCVKKKRRGLKGMESMDSDSD